MVSGAIAAACNVAMRALLSLVVSYEVAIVLAYGVGMIVAFFLMRAFVFQPATRSTKGAEMARFSVVNLLGLGQTLLVSEVVVRWAAPAVGVTHQAELIGHGLGVGAPIVTSFFGHKYFSFRKGTA